MSSYTIDNWTISLAEQPVIIRYRDREWRANARVATCGQAKVFLSVFELWNWNTYRSDPPFTKRMHLVVDAKGKVIASAVHAADALCEASRRL